MTTVLFTLSVDHLLNRGEKLDFIQSSGLALLSKAEVVAHRDDPRLGNLFTLRATYLLPFLSRRYVVLSNSDGEGLFSIIDRTAGYIDFEINWIAGYSVETIYDVAVIGL